MTIKIPKRYKFIAGNQRYNPALHGAYVKTIYITFNNSCCNSSRDRIGDIHLPTQCSAPYIFPLMDTESRFSSRLEVGRRFPMRISPLHLPHRWLRRFSVGRFISAWPHTPRHRHLRRDRCKRHPDCFCLSGVSHPPARLEIHSHCACAQRPAQPRHTDLVILHTHGRSIRKFIHR